MRRLGGGEMGAPDAPVQCECLPESVCASWTEARVFSDCATSRRERMNEGQSAVQKL